MRYGIAECNRIFKFFEKDFFEEVLGSQLGDFRIAIDLRDAEDLFGMKIDSEHLSGLSIYVDGIAKVYVNKLLCDNKKLMANTILHEMIHIYLQKNFPYSKANHGHGPKWLSIARKANSIYEGKIGRIEACADEYEMNRKAHYALIHSTKSLGNVYVVVLASRDLVPVKHLTEDQIETLKRTNIRGIFKVKPNLEQSESNRVKNYATFDMLMDDIEQGISWDEEQMYSSLDLKLGTDSVCIWRNAR